MHDLQTRREENSMAVAVDGLKPPHGGEMGTIREARTCTAERGGINIDCSGNSCALWYTHLRKTPQGVMGFMALAFETIGETSAIRNTCR